MAKTTKLALQEEQVDITAPNAAIDYATQIAKIITEKQMFTKIRDKAYVNVEGWQLASALLGYYPVTEGITDCSTDNEIKYQAQVSLYYDDKDGQPHLIGKGFAMCSNKEHTKRNFDEYAIASMAQTRALGKACRMKLGWLLKIAGYEATPAEEMAEAEVVEAKPVESKPKPAPKPKAKPKVDKDRGEALARVKEVTEMCKQSGITGAQIAEAVKTISDKPSKEMDTGELITVADALIGTFLPDQKF